jgi:CRISPR-associated protein Csx14
MSIRIQVDPSNPGQFFACCGLLELADRLWGSAEGWFDARAFSIDCKGNLQDSLALLVMDPPERLLKYPPERLEKLDEGLPVKPIIAPLRFTFDGGASCPLTINAWTQVRIENKKPAVVSNPPWNFWSGNQTSFGIWSDLRLALATQLPLLKGDTAEDILSRRLPLTGRFGFDPGAAWNALDVGFSPNTQKMPVASSPATEMLAAIGIQRFRPVLSDDRNSFLYSTWGQPLIPAVAAAAASSLVLVAPAKRFRGYIAERGKYAALGYSKQLYGDSQ